MSPAARQAAVERILNTAGLAPSLVDIGRDDDLPYAKFRVGDSYLTLTGEGDSDSAGAADIIRQADERGVPRRWTPGILG